MSSLSKFFLGSPQRFEQLPTGTPEQQNLINMLISGLSGQQTAGPLGMGFENLQNILSGRPEALQAFEAPARRSFSETTIPQIAERFTGVGGQRSSAFGQQLGSAAAGLEEGLSAQRSGLQSQALQQLMGLLGQSQAPQFQTTSIEAQPGLLQYLLKALGQIGGSFGTQLLG